jgi:hypothetical protein
METIAVYFEPVARPYGIETVIGVAMVRAPLSRENFLKNLRLAPTPSSAPEKFLFVMVQYETDAEASLFAVTQPEEIAGILTSFGLSESPEIIIQPVDMLFFQGPHFYERYGIAASVVAKLREKKTDLIAAGFSGSMAYLVVPAGAAESAKAALAECLHLP